MHDIRAVLLIIGLMLSALGIAMFPPILVDIAYGSKSSHVFFISAFLTIFTGASISFLNWGQASTLSLRGALLVTSGSWLVLSFFASLPFLFSDPDLGFTNAFFESMSGLTTTGSTVLTGLDIMPKGILLWRALLQWIGGIGIIVTAIAVLPMLKIGGMQLFRLESSDNSEKILPRAQQIAGSIALIYIVLTLACAINYMITGMTAFDAIAHAMSTMSTGGFSTSDGSIGSFMNQGSDIVGSFFMIMAGLPFGLYLMMVRGHYDRLWRDPQVGTYLIVLFVLILTMTLYFFFSKTTFIERGSSLPFAFRHIVFNTISVITGTGFATEDYGAWGTFPSAAFFIFMFIGGCAGSTAGSIKIFRYQVVFAVLKSYIFRMGQPNGVIAMRYGNRSLDMQTIFSVLNFFFLFFLCFSVGVLLLSVMGLDSLTAWSGAATAIGNVGAGLGPVIGPATTFASLPVAAKWVLIFLMLIGRLEIITALALLTPRFWLN